MGRGKHLNPDVLGIIFGYCAEESTVEYPVETMLCCRHALAYWIRCATPSVLEEMRGEAVRTVTDVWNGFAGPIAEP